jgi:hypothetical protein
VLKLEFLTFAAPSGYPSAKSFLHFLQEGAHPSPLQQHPEFWGVRDSEAPRIGVKIRWRILGESPWLFWEKILSHGHDFSQQIRSSGNSDVKAPYKVMVAMSLISNGELLIL